MKKVWFLKNVGALIKGNAEQGIRREISGCSALPWTVSSRLTEFLCEEKSKYWSSSSKFSQNFPFHCQVPPIKHFDAIQRIQKNLLRHDIPVKLPDVKFPRLTKRRSSDQGRLLTKDFEIFYSAKNSSTLLISQKSINFTMRPLPSSICEELENWKLDRVIGSTKNNKILLHLSQADDLRSVKIDLEIEEIISDQIGTVVYFWQFLRFQILKNYFN